MTLTYESLESELIEVLQANRIWILATSLGGKTTARAVSVINSGTTIYFQTWNMSEKYQQMIGNPNVALSYSNASIEGVAQGIGHWDRAENTEIMQKYIDVHRGSFERYGKREDEVVIQIIPTRAKFWKYIDGKPHIDLLLIQEREATRTAFV